MVFDKVRERGIEHVNFGRRLRRTLHLIISLFAVLYCVHYLEKISRTNMKFILFILLDYFKIFAPTFKKLMAKASASFEII